MVGYDTLKHWLWKYTELGWVVKMLPIRSSAACLEDLSLFAHPTKGVFAVSATCHRVTRGSHPLVHDAQADAPEDKELFFGDEVTFGSRDGESHHRGGGVPPIERTIGRITGAPRPSASDGVPPIEKPIGVTLKVLGIKPADEGKAGRAGEPTDAAIRVLVEELGCPDASVNERCLQKPLKNRDAMTFSKHWEGPLKKLATLEFARDRKSMSVLAKGDADFPGNVPYAKGAPESIVDRCTKIMLPDGKIENLTDEGRKTILKCTEDMAPCARTFPP